MKGRIILSLATQLPMPAAEKHLAHGLAER
jgi:hypothetical protein